MITKIVNNNLINSNDILFCDNDVCILKPEIKKGIVIFTNYTQPKNMPSLCESGLKTGYQLQKEGINFGRNIIHDCIFFRAPYYSNIIDYTTINTEIISSYGEEHQDKATQIWIRIDPERTFVYSSEIRAAYHPHFYYNSPDYLHAIDNEVKKSRKIMTNYLQIINDNLKIISKYKNDIKFVYNLYTSNVLLISSINNINYPFNNKMIINRNKYFINYPFNNINYPFNNINYPFNNINYPFNNIPINRNSEVLVKIPHLTSNYFVKCT
jgi:hypothetical protein